MDQYQRPMNQQQQHFSRMYCIASLSMGISGSDEWTHGHATTAFFGSSHTGGTGHPGLQSANLPLCNMDPYLY